MPFLLSILFPLLASVYIIPTFVAKPAEDADYMTMMDEGIMEVFPGCSWYCGGDVHGFKASSSLPDYKNISYAPKNAHDFDIYTAWVEGAPGYGIGEYLEYTFDFSAIKQKHYLGITQIVLANGYKKSKKNWQANSRVKEMKMYIDGEPYAMLELLDNYEFQTIEIGKIMLPQNKPMVVRFEIVSVYPGNTYKDTAISELLFTGVGVH